VTDSIELVAPIAEGAMGKVWVAYHHRLRTRVAVKFVHERVVGDDAREALARFEQEAAMAAQIKSPHVVQTYDSGFSNEGMPYIVMELLEGHSLGDRLRTQGPLGWGDATAVVAQVARALTKAHELGIVHRDIKPDNIYLCRSDEGIFCKVLDFGIAKQTRLPSMGGLTTDGKIVGTPEFMSPEQVLEDRPVDFRADLWALAVVMYVSVTGQFPFQGKTLGQLCLNLVNRRPPAPSTLRVDLPPGADEWFARALSRDPSQRFTSAREMAMSFAAALGTPSLQPDLQSPTLLASTRPSAPVPSEFPSFPVPAETPTVLRRRRARPVLAVLAVLGLLLVAGAVSVLAGGTATPPAPAAKVVGPPAEPGDPVDGLADAEATPTADPTSDAAPPPSDAPAVAPTPPPLGPTSLGPAARTLPAPSAPPPSTPTAAPKTPKAGERDLGF
jgi:serine/threonine protein kinase